MVYSWYVMVYLHLCLRSSCEILLATAPQETFGHPNVNPQTTTVAGETTKKCQAKWAYSDLVAREFGTCRRWRGPPPVSPGMCSTCRNRGSAGKPVRKHCRPQISIEAIPISYSGPPKVVRLSRSLWCDMSLSFWHFVKLGCSNVSQGVDLEKCPQLVWTSRGAISRKCSVLLRTLISKWMAQLPSVRQVNMKHFAQLWL